MIETINEDARLRRLPSFGTAEEDVVCTKSGSSSSRRVLLVANTSWYAYNFRRKLAKQLQELGADVSIVAPRDKYSEKLVAEGIPWIEWIVDRRGINPFREYRSVNALKTIYAKYKPDIIHHFTVKCVIYGTLASRPLPSCRIVNTVTGLGHFFLSDSSRSRLARPVMKRMYRWALTRSNVRPMFQNMDDARILLPYHSPNSPKPIVTAGSGIDLEEFSPIDAIDRVADSEPLRVMFVGRIVTQKGIREFVEAAHALKELQPNVDFIACGDRDRGNRSVIDDSTFRSWEDRGIVRFLGHQENIADQMRKADIVVLPSYREGTPRSLMEASALGKPIVATDVPGCREVAINGRNAILVPPRNSKALADAILLLIQSAELRSKFGIAGSELSQRYDVHIINEQIIDAYEIFRPSKPR